MSESLFGKYRLRELLARGGMAEIHLAVERLPHGGERIVVLKRILPVHQDDPDFVEFFRHEGRVALQLSHPNIVQAHEFGVLGDTLYLAMEYVRGHSVLDVIRRAAATASPVALDAAVKIACDVASALDYAHRACDADGRPLEIVHRDVSPHNIVLSRDGIAKLADFGIAKAACQEFKTRTGVIKGKFAYLAPEMLQRGSSFDHRADLFALGTVTYELLTCRPLFRGVNEADTVKRILSGKIPPLRELRPDVPAALEAVIHKALARDPDKRYQTGAQLLNDLEEAAHISGVFPTSTRLRAELDHLFEEGVPTSIWTHQAAAPAAPAPRVAGGSRSPDPEVDGARPPVRPPRPVRPPIPARVLPPTTPPTRPAVPMRHRTDAPSFDALAGPLPAVVPTASAKPPGLSPAAAAAGAAAIASGAITTAGLALDPEPLPPQPRLASPPPEAIAPAPPLPDRQLEYFLGLASARRARADTHGLPESSPKARLGDEALSLLLDAATDSGLEDSGATPIDLEAVPLPAPPDDTSREPSLGQAPLSSIDTGSLPTAELPVLRAAGARRLAARGSASPPLGDADSDAGADAHAADAAPPLPLPAPPHRTPPPERLGSGPASPTLRDVGDEGDDGVPSLFGDMADMFEPQLTNSPPATPATPATAMLLPSDLRLTPDRAWGRWFAAAAVVALAALAFLLAAS